MKSDIEIARSIELTKIKQIARETGIPVEHISNYGRYIAKVVEIQPHQFAPAVDDRRTGVAARRVVGGQEADGYRLAAVDRRRPAPVVLRGVELAQGLRDVVVVNLGIVLGDDAE